MGFRRYVASSAREALEKIRKELGPEAVILSNRRSGAGKVEIIAAAQGQMRALVDELAPKGQEAPATRADHESSGERPSERRARRTRPESFQEFIRRQSTISAPRPDAVAMYTAVANEASATPPASPAIPRERPAGAADEVAAPAVFRRRPSRLAAVDRPKEPKTDARKQAPAGAPPVPPRDAPAPASANEVTARAAAHKPQNAAPAAATSQAAAEPEASPPAKASAAVDGGVMAELRLLRSALSDRISNLETKMAAAPAAEKKIEADASALGTARHAMTRLLMSGFSPELVRRIGEVVPPQLEPKDIDKWLQAVIARHLRCPEDVDNPLFQPGAIALVGPTGVGKTTTIAKLAARFVVRHGAGALGLVTLDSYRIGGHEQLRSYGRILGVPVHSTHDAVSLRDLLASMQGKRQILIDTCGVSQRDQRLAEMLAMLDEVRFAEQKIRRVLLINAASHAETLDEVARAWRVESSLGAVLTKIDEAARIGGALDAVLRYQIPLLGLTNGQRVPEDWHPGNPALLAHIALKPFGAAFRLGA